MKLQSPDEKRRAVEEVIEKLEVSERKACEVLEQPRSTQRRQEKANDLTEKLTMRITEIAVSAVVMDTVEIFDTIYEAQVVAEKWRRYYNILRPHSALGYKPPARKQLFHIRLPMLDNGKKLIYHWYTNQGAGQTTKRRYTVFTNLKFIVPRRKKSTRNMSLAHFTKTFNNTFLDFGCRSFQLQILK